MRIFVRGVILLVGLMVLAGCAPAQTPTAAPVPTPSVPVCTPLDGSTPFPCTQADFESLAEQRKLYEAERVFVRYRAEVKRQEVDWRLREMTPELEGITTGKFRTYVQQLIDQDRAEEAARVSEAAAVSWIKPAVGESRSGSVVDLRLCVDARSEQYVTKDANAPVPGVVTEHVYYFISSDNALKLGDSTSSRVQSC